MIFPWYFQLIEKTFEARSDERINFFEWFYAERDFHVKMERNYSENLLVKKTLEEILILGENTMGRCWNERKKFKKLDQFDGQLAARKCF